MHEQCSNGKLSCHNKPKNDPTMLFLLLCFQTLVSARLKKVPSPENKCYCFTDVNITMIFYKLFSSFPLKKTPTEPTTAHGSRCSSWVPRTSLASRTDALRWIADPNRRRCGSETKKQRWLTANQAVKHRMGLKRHGFTMANLERFFSFSWVRLGYKLSRVIHIC